ncbi:MAG: hypothetical protein K2O59_09005 [Lachnospiraceae bacterium]|nr:hypothetical protein [Lachnospiraceae bacterium]
MNPDIKYEIVMVIAMTACFVSGFLFAGWNGEKAVQSYAPAERCELDLFMIDPLCAALREV